MAKRVLLTSLALLAGIALLLATAYQFRVAVIRAAADAFVPSDTAVLGALQGVDLGTQGAAIAELELLLPASGLRVVIHDLRLGYALKDLLLARKVDSLTIASLALTRAPSLTAVPETPDSPLLLSDLLALLRELPLTSLDIADIRIPDRQESLHVTLQRRGGNLNAGVVSGALQLLASVDQQQAATRLQLQLMNGASQVADFSLNLIPASSGFHLAGTGHADVADFATLLGEPLLALLGLPLAALQLDLSLEADLADAVLATPPAQFALQIEGGSMLALNATLIQGLDGLTVRSEETVLLEFATGTAAASGRLPLVISGSWQQQPFDARLVFAAADCRLQAASVCSVDFDGSANLAALVIPADAGNPAAAATIVNALTFAGDGTVSRDGNSLLMTLAPDARVALGAVTGPTLQIAGLALSTGAPLMIGSTLDGTGMMTLEGEQVSGTLTQLATKGYTLDSAFSLRDFRLASAGMLAGEAVLQTQGLQAQGAGWLPAVDIAATLKLEDGTLAFATPLLLPAAPADPGISLRGSYRLDSGAVAASLEVPPLLFDGPGASLSAYFGGWPFAFDLLTGSLGAALAVEWTPAAAGPAATDPAAGGILTGTLSATLDAAAGYYGEMFFAGLDTQLDASIDSAAPLSLSTPLLAVRIATLDVGLPVTDIAVDFRVDGAAQTVTVAAFNAALLGGTLSGEDVSYSLASARNFLNLRFTGLRLERMLELVEYDGIEVSGAVSGLLPLAITGNGVEVDAGRLFAEAPGGSIRYLDGPTAGSGGNLGVDLVNQALGNYQFDSLESSIDYSPEGELLLGMQLQGRNPDMNNGQRINLNLNLSNNIPDLLESLQAGRAIEEFLEGQYGPQSSP